MLLKKKQGENAILAGIGKKFPVLPPGMPFKLKKFHLPEGWHTIYATLAAQNFHFGTLN